MSSKNKPQQTNNISLKNILRSTAFVGLTLMGYSGRSYAAPVCTNISGANYLCSGNANSPALISADNIQVTTDSIFSINTSYNNALTITGNGALSFTDSNNSEITTTDSGASALVVVSDGDAGATDGSITITTNGDILGGTDAIYAISRGGGSINITSDGDVTASTYRGIFAKNYGQDINITTYGEVTGDDVGIQSINVGAGSTTIFANGDVTATGTGIHAVNEGTDLAIYSYGNVSSNNALGILALNNGSGELNLIIDGNVSSENSTAIGATNHGTNINFEITNSNSVITGSGGNGVGLTNNGSGELNVALDGTISAPTYRGVDLVNHGTNVEVTDTEDTIVNALVDGIRVNNQGSGETNINVSGDIDVGGYVGILVANTGTNVNVTTQETSTINATTDGIKVTNTGSGEINIDVAGDLNVSGSTGILVSNSGTDINILTRDTSTINTGYFGIRASNLGDGITTINSGAEITTGGRGIDVLNYGSNVIINQTADITAVIDGIRVDNRGEADVNIAVEGDIDVSGYVGVLVGTTAPSDNIYINVAEGKNITANLEGIKVTNNGSGVIDIASYGNITSNNSTGILAYNNTGTNTLIYTGEASSITSRFDGIRAVSIDDALDINIKSHGSITSSAANGITALNSNSGVDITSSGEISALNNGIYTNNRGGVINSSGDISAGNMGIFAITSGVDLNVNIGGNIESAYTGVNILNNGIGKTIIDSGANITSTSLNGIYVNNGSITDNIEITTAENSEITALRKGIFVINNGLGSIEVENNANISTYENGMHILNYGEKGTNITTTGVISSSGVGIYSRNFSNEETNITIEGDVNAGFAGLVSLSYGANNIVVDGSVISVSVIGMYARSLAESNITIDGTRKQAGIVTYSGYAAYFGTRDDSLTATGDVVMVGAVLGGEQVEKDTLNLNNATITGDENLFSGFEEINISGASELNGILDAVGDEVNFANNSSLHVNGAFLFDTLTVNNHSELGGNNLLTGNVIIADTGTLAPGNSAGTIVIAGNLTLQNGSNLEIEIDGANFDTLATTGDIDIQDGATLNLVDIGAIPTSATGDFLLAQGAINGEFSTINTPEYVSVTYDANASRFKFVSVGFSDFSTTARALEQSSDAFKKAITESAVQDLNNSGKNFWTKAIIQNSNFGSHSSSGKTFSGFKDSVYGASFGASNDYSKNIRLGYSIADLVTNATTHNSGSKTEANSYLASIYSTYSNSDLVKDNNLFATSGVTVGFDKIKGGRRVVNGSTTSIARHDTNAIETGLFLQAGSEYSMDKNFIITPKIGAEYNLIRQNGYNEHNGGTASLRMRDQSLSKVALSQEVEVTSKKAFSYPNGVFTVKPRASVGLVEEALIDGRKAEVNLTNGNNLSISLDDSNQVYKTFSLGADFEFAKNINGYASFDRDMGQTENQNQIKIGFSKKF